MRLPRAGACAFSLVALLLAIACSGGEEPAPAADASQPPVEDVVEAQPSPIEEDPQAPTVAPLQHSNIRVYFPSTSGNGLIYEHREIFETTTPEDRTKQILAALIEGPESKRGMRAVPRGTKLRQAYLLENGVAYLDFSRELTISLGGGSMREMLTTYAIVDSVTRNVPEVRAVGFLIEGRVTETLNGHLDLRYPLRPNYKMVLADASVPTPSDDEPPVRIAGAP